MRVVVDTSNYDVIELITADAIVQPDFFESRAKSLIGRLSGKTGEYISGVSSGAIKAAKDSIVLKMGEISADAVCDVRISTSIDEIGGDFYAKAFIQAIALKRKGGK